MLGNRASHVKPHVRILARRKKRSFQQRGIRLANPPPRRGRLDLRRKKLSVRRQCALLGLARSGVYRAPAPPGEDDAAAMRRIDALYTEHSFYGSRRIAFTLRMNRKRAQQRMRLMEIEALGSKPRTSKPAPEHRIYPKNGSWPICRFGGLRFFAFWLHQLDARGAARGAGGR